MEAFAAEGAEGGLDVLSPYMSSAQINLVLRGAQTASATIGRAIQAYVFARLAALAPDRFATYFNYGPDFTDFVLGVNFELTTYGQQAAHMARDYGVDVYYALYSLEGD
jgi:hypothetical protein